MRICPGCKEPKPAEAFAPRQSRCRVCRDQLNKTYYANNREALLAYQKEKAAKERIAALTALSGGAPKCVCCGEKELAFLTVDHANDDGAEHRRELGTRNTTALYRWLAKNDYPPGFQVLCWNCNWGRRVNQGVCPHNK